LIDKYKIEIFGESFEKVISTDMLAHFLIILLILNTTVTGERNTTQYDFFHKLPPSFRSVQMQPLVDRSIPVTEIMIVPRGGFN
jgi:hypothetical protein